MTLSLSTGRIPPLPSNCQAKIASGTLSSLPLMTSTSTALSLNISVHCLAEFNRKSQNVFRQVNTPLIIINKYNISVLFLLFYVGLQCYH